MSSKSLFVISEDNYVMFSCYAKNENEIWNYFSNLYNESNDKFIYRDYMDEYIYKHIFIESGMKDDKFNMTPEYVKDMFMELSHINIEEIKPIQL